MPDRSGALQVRRALPHDAAGVAGVLADVAAEGRWILAEAPVDVAARAQEVAEAISAGAITFWVLVAYSRIVGNLGLHRSTAAGVGDLGMAILADYRNRGGGHALLQSAIEHASNTGLHKLQLEVFTDNARAIALYSRLGFVVEGVRQRHYRRADGSLKDALVMALMVDAAA